MTNNTTEILTTVITYQEYFNIVNKDQKYRVFNNQLYLIENVRLLDVYSDVLTGVPVVIDCYLVSISAKTVFKFGDK